MPADTASVAVPLASIRAGAPAARRAARGASQSAKSPRGPRRSRSARWATSTTRPCCGRPSTSAFTDELRLSELRVPVRRGAWAHRAGARCSTRGRRRTGSGSRARIPDRSSGGCSSACAGGCAARGGPRRREGVLRAGDRASSRGRSARSRGPRGGPALRRAARSRRGRRGAWLKASDLKKRATGPDAGPRVLVVDDHLEMAETLAEGLGERGFERDARAARASRRRSRLGAGAVRRARDRPAHAARSTACGLLARSRARPRPSGRSS